MAYPNTLDTFTDVVDDPGGDTVMAAHINGPHDSIEAIEAELGTLPKGSYDLSVAALLARLNRYIDAGISFGEHWKAGADQLVWTGWAAYVGYSTPNNLAFANHSYRAVHTAGAVEAFRYRAAIAGANIALSTRCIPLYNATAGTVRVGLMLDDGVDKGDGSGPNNYYRVMIEMTGPAANMVMRREYRVGGGAAAAAVTGLSFPPTMPVVISLTAAGTRWTSYAMGAYYYGELSSGAMQYDGGPFTFTPARCGIYLYGSAANLWGIWDSFDD